MESMSLSERKKLYRVCAAALLAEAFEHLEEEEAAVYFNELDIKKASAVTEELEADTAANILHQIGREKRALIIDALFPEIQSDIRLLASFEEASTVFYDDRAILFDDPEHSYEEERFLIIGTTTSSKICIVSHCYRDDDEIIRIISARKATKSEKNVYEENM